MLQRSHGGEVTEVRKSLLQMPNESDLLEQMFNVKKIK